MYDAAKSDRLSPIYREVAVAALVSNQLGANGLRRHCRVFQCRAKAGDRRHGVIRLRSTAFGEREHRLTSGFVYPRRKRRRAIPQLEREAHDVPSDIGGQSLKRAQGYSDKLLGIVGSWRTDTRHGTENLRHPRFEAAHVAACGSDAPQFDNIFIKSAELIGRSPLRPIEAAQYPTFQRLAEKYKQQTDDQSGAGGRQDGGP
jgi:hypothetical protein